MKTMNYLFLMSLMLLGISCSEPEMDNEEPLATDLRYRGLQETQYLNGLELYKSALAQNIHDLGQEISELKEAIDGGRKDLLPNLNAAQQNKSALLEYKGDLVSLRAPRGGKFPPPIPKGCWDDPKAGCDPKINFSDFGGIQITEGLEGAQVEIRNSKNEIVGKGGRISRTRSGLQVMAVEANFSGEATMHITPENRLFSKGLALTIKVYNN